MIYLPHLLRSMKTNDLIEFDKWVRKETKLITNYLFLYRLERFMVKKNKIEKTLLKIPIKVKKNIKK